MSLVLTVRIRLGNSAMQSSADLASALEGVAERIRESGYVETLRENPGDQISRAVSDGNGQGVGEFSLGESPV